MINIGIDDLMKKTDSVFKLVILASRRAYELSQGSPKLVEADLAMKPSVLALKEIVEDKISYKIRKS